MGFGIAKLMLLLQLSVLLVNCFTVSGEDIATISTATAPTHNHYPVAAPTQPPSHHHHHHPHPPTVSPAHPPSHKGLAPAHSPGHHHHHHHHHPHPPSPSPIQSPSPSPYHHTPAHPPSHAPAHPPPHTPASPPHAPASPPPHTPASPPPHTPASPPPHTPASPPHTPASPPPHTPASPPPHTPAHPPHTPAASPHTPAHPPRIPSPRSFVAVQGVVYCKSCKYAGVDTLLNATAVLDATVKLQCNNTKYPLVLTAKTDKNGYFFISAPKTITTFGAHKCKVSLISSPVVTCNKPSNLHYGLTGALLKPQKPYMAEKLPFFLYNVGPFAFEPKCYH